MASTASGKARSNRLADVYEGNFTAGQKYYLVVVREGGLSDLACAVYPATAGGIYGRGGALAQSGATSPTSDTLSFVASANGWYPIVVYRTNIEHASVPVTYDLIVGAGVPVDVSEDGASAAGPTFEEPRPNPARGRGVMEFTLKGAGPVRLDLYDLQGRRVQRLVDGVLEAGRHQLPWVGRLDDGVSLPAGIYFACLDAEGRRITRRIVVFR